MIHPILINFKEPITGDIGTMVLDVHADSILSIVRQPDGTTGVHTKLGVFYPLIPFVEFMDIYEHYNSGIDRRYEEEITSYYKDNYLTIRKDLENGNRE